MFDSNSRLCEILDCVLYKANVEILRCGTSEDIELFRVKYLGSRGLVKESFKLLSLGEDKVVLGQKMNSIKEDISNLYQNKKDLLGLK